jgi:hypothetical protein
MGFLRRLFGEPATIDPPRRAQWSEPGEGPFDVEAIPGEWQYQVTFDDVVAHEEEDRVASFVERLSVERGIRQAVHEDREVVLIKADRVSPAEMQLTAERVWGDTEHEPPEDLPDDDG